MRDVLIYSALRLGLFALVWWLLTLAGIGTYMAGIIAALIAMLISILFLRRPRTRAAERWQAADERRRERRAETRDLDADEEDERLDGPGPGEKAAARASEREAGQQED